MADNKPTDYDRLKRLDTIEFFTLFSAWRKKMKQIAAAAEEAKAKSKRNGRQ